MIIEKMTNWNFTPTLLMQKRRWYNFSVEGIIRNGDSECKDRRNFTWFASVVKGEKNETVYGFFSN